MSPDILIPSMLGFLILSLTLVMLCVTTDLSVVRIRVPFILLIILSLCALSGLILTAVFPSASLTLWWLP